MALAGSILHPALLGSEMFPHSFLENVMFPKDPPPPRPSNKEK